MRAPAEAMGELGVGESSLVACDGKEEDVRLEMGTVHVGNAVWYLCGRRLF